MNKKQLAEIAEKLKKQVIQLPDGSNVTIQVKPKWGKRTVATITWDKTIDNVDLNISISGQPITCTTEGIGIDLNQNENSFSAQASATYKF
jgi:hypothetical protein